MLSTNRCMGAPSQRGRGNPSVVAWQPSVARSGTLRVSPSRPMMESIKPPIWRKARRNTVRSVIAVRIARGEYQGWPPAVVRGEAVHAATASSVNQIVKLPRWRKAASYAAEFMTLRLYFGMW